MPDDFLFKPVPHEQAMSFISNKPVIAQDVFAQLLPALKARAFTISGIESANVLQKVRDRIAELPSGANWDDIKADIATDMSPYFVDSDADAETQAAQEAAAERRADLLIRTHGFEAYQAASFEVMDRQRDVFEYWQYSTMGGDAVRPEHAALNGLILPENSSFWADHFAPWDWGCRCQVIPIMKEELDGIVERGAGYTLSETQQKELEQNGRLALDNGQVINVSSPAASGKDGAFSWNPGDLRIPVDQLEQRYDPEVWKTFKSWASAEKLDDEGLTVMGWLNQEPGTPLTQKVSAGTILPVRKPTPRPQKSTPVITPPEDAAVKPDATKAVAPKPAAQKPVKLTGQAKTDALKAELAAMKAKNAAGKAELEVKKTNVEKLKQEIAQLQKLPELSDKTPRTSKLNPPDSKLPKDILAWKTTAPAATKEALKTYTVAPSKVNDPLRVKGATKETLTGEARKMSEYLSKAFAAQPQFKEPIRTWRGISLDEKQSTAFLKNVDASMKAGKPLQMKGYTSTSLDPAYANSWAGDIKTGYVFEIEAKHGVYIDEKTSSVSGQRELLLDHDTKYKITGVKEVQMEYRDKLYSRKVIQLVQI